MLFSIGTSASVMKQVASLLENEAGPKLIDSGCIPSSWVNCIKLVQDQKLRGSKSEKLHVKGVIVLDIRIREVKVQALFGNFDKLAERLILGTKFIDRFLKSILLEENWFLPKHSKPVVILENYSNEISTMAGAKLEEERDEKRRPLFLVAR